MTDNDEALRSLPQSHGTSTRKPTIYSIAAELGLSPSAVSRALRHPGRLNAQTEERIRQAAQRLGYHTETDDSSKPLLPAATMLVGIIVPDISDPLTNHAIDGMNRRLAARGYRAIIMEEHDILTRDGLSAQFRKLPICGVLIQSASVGAPLQQTPTAMPHTPSSRNRSSTQPRQRRALTLSDQEMRALAKQMPLVSVGRRIDRVHYGSLNVAPAVERMVTALRDTGHRSISYLIGANETARSEPLRQELACEAARQGMRMQTLLASPRDPAAAESTLERFLRRPTHAVFASDNAIATPFMAAAIRHGIRVPDELSVIGFGDDLSDGFNLPSLARISSPMDELGADCADLLISLIQRQNADDVERAAVFHPGASLGDHRHDITPAASAIDLTPDVATSASSAAETQAEDGSAPSPATVREPLTLTIMASSFQDWDSHVNAYAKLHPEVTIRRVNGGTQAETVAEYYRRMRSGVDIPDITVIEYRWLPQLVEDRMLLNLNTPAIRATFRPQFTADCWNAVSIRGGIYGVPCDYDTTVMFCRMDLLARYGLTVPRTWKEIEEAGAMLRESGHGDVAASAISTVDSAAFIGLFTMASAEPWSVNGDRIRLRLTSEPVARTTALIHRLIDEGTMIAMNFEQPEFIPLVRDGRVATLIGANWFCENITRYWPDEQGLWRVMLPPSFAEPSELVTTHIGGSAWTISNRAPKYKRNAAAQFAFWSQSDPASVELKLDRILSATTYFHRNARLTDKIDPYFEQRLYDVFFESAEHLNPAFVYLPFMPQVEGMFADTIRPQLVPGGHLEQAMASWQSQIAAFAKAKGYQVEIEE